MSVVPLLLTSPRTEKMLVSRTQELQARVDVLERRLREQSNELGQKNTGGTFADHWTQSWCHLCQAFAVLCRTFDPDDRGGRSDNGSEVADKRRVMGDLIPDWSGSAEILLAKRAFDISPAMVPQASVDGERPLEDHEYLLEEEWAHHGVNSSSNYVIYPDARLKEVWDFGVLLAILYSCVSVPFRFCFSSNAEGLLLVFEIAISLFFCVDVLFNFNLAYLIDEKWVISRPRIAARYLRGWFWVDAPSSVPVELIALVGNHEGNQYLSTLRVLRMFRLLRLMRLLKIDTYIARIEDAFKINLVGLRILGMVTRLLYMVHLLGCFWFYVGISSLSAGYETSWITAYNSGAAYEDGVATQYRYAVYWAITTVATVGYGDLTPQNDWERDYSMLAMLIGAMMFGYMVSTVGSIVATFEREAFERQRKMDSVKDWMASRNVPQKLFVRVRTYYEHYYAKKSAFNEEEILSSLPPGLRNECTSMLLRDTLGVFPLFALVGIDFQRAVYPHLKPVMYVHQDLIYKRGDKAEDTYFLRKGAVDVLAGGSGTLVLFRVNQGQHFGEEAFTNQKRASNIISNGMTEAWTLSNDKLEDVVRQLGRAVRSKLEDFITLELARKQRLNSLSYRALIAEAKSADRRAALIMQKAFVSFANKKAREASSIFAELQADVKEPSVGRGATGASSGALHSVLFEIRQQMKAMKTTLKSQSDLLERTARVPNEAPDMLSPRSDSTARTSASARRSKCVSMNSFVCRPACNQAPSTISAA